MKLRTWLAAMLVALALMTVPVALAKEKDDDDRDDDKRGKGGDRREVRVEREEGAFEYRLRDKSGGDKSEVRLRFNAEEGYLKLHTEFKNKTEKESLKLKVRFHELVEYTDVNANGEYDPGVDLRLSAHTPKNLTWTIGKVAQTTLAGEPAASIAAMGKIPASNGSLTLVFYAVGDVADVWGLRLHADDVKFDIVINDYPYTTPLSRLALVAKVQEKSEHKIKDYEGDDENGRGFASVAEGAKAYFKWAENATVDGVDTTVKSTVVREKEEVESDEDEDERERVTTVILNYAHGREIVHDPVIGVQTAAESVKEAPFGGAVGTALAVVAAVLVVGRRRSG